VRKAADVQHHHHPQASVTTTIMAPPSLLPDSSDPLTYICSCSVSNGSSSGLVLLFYRYYASPPSLPPSIHQDPSNTPASLAAFHSTLASTLQLGGKVRIAPEGFNITIGGTSSSIQTYITTLLTHWSLASLGLSTEAERNAFFKPSPGCACVFAGKANVRVCAEITPMGVTDYEPVSWEAVESLSPAEFHNRCMADDQPGRKTTLLDVRNHYESRIGCFVDRNGTMAVRPGIRRFSQWPGWVGRNLDRLSKNEGSEGGGGREGGEVAERGEERQILTYCTGGIRCEKGVRFMQESLALQAATQNPHQDHHPPKPRIATLKGGIAAYLTWVDAEISAGRMMSSDSLFKGRNYVFDARGWTSLSTVETKPISTCHICSAVSDRLDKCHSDGCHLVLVVCEMCAGQDPRCCRDCKEMAAEISISISMLSGKGEELDGAEIMEEIRPCKTRMRTICECEKAREWELWGGEKIVVPKLQRLAKGKRKGKEKERGEGLKAKGRLDLDIRVKVID
jgi:predicted sulfurtransferase